MLPWIIPVARRLFGQYDGFAFFIFIFYYRDTPNRAQILNHERIHFWQQVELLFLGHWVLYLLFYAWYRIIGLTHDCAYRAIPFEREAYRYEHDLSYLEGRKIFAWLYPK